MTAAIVGGLLVAAIPIVFVVVVLGMTVFLAVRDCIRGRRRR